VEAQGLQRTFSLTAGDAHSCAVSWDAPQWGGIGVYCWGANDSLQSGYHGQSSFPRWVILGELPPLE